MVIIKHSFPIMVAHTTITTIYIIVIEVSCMHLLLCAICCYVPKLKRGMASFFEQISISDLIFL